MKRATPQSPRVLVGSRTLTRGRRLTQWLKAQRCDVIGAYTRGAALLEHLEREPGVCLLLEATLEDGPSLSFIHSVMLRKPSPIVQLCPAASGELVLSALRAGAVECVPWPQGGEGDRGALAQLVAVIERAWSRRDHLPGFAHLRVVGSDARVPEQPEPTRQLVLLLGADAMGGLFMAIERAPRTLRSAIIGVDLVHPTLRQPFARRLQRHTEFHVRTEVGEANELRAALYLLGASEMRGVLSLRRGGAAADPREQAEAFARRTVGWMNVIQQSLITEQLEQVLLVVHGEVDAALAGQLERLITSGAVLGEATFEGYRVRHREQQSPLQLTTDAFWAAIHQGDEERAA